MHLVGFIIRTGQEIVKLVACCEEILKERNTPLSRQTSVIEFINPYPTNVENRVSS